MSGRARAPLRPGARVGGFVVREEIGFGATSIVYEAEHRTVRHRVAIKVLRSLGDPGDELRLRFEREMKLCSSLRSTHVPHVYELGELPSGLPYIVMERLNGASLADWLAVHRRLPVAVVVEIGLQLCEALEALHERGVVHRDVKPENLVLHQAFSDGYIVKLVDFGICKPLAENGPALTRRGTVVGTPEYMSPEQVQGIDVDPRTDVYSAGILLYELLAGRTPFEGHDLDVLGRAILFASPPRLASLREEVSALLESIIMRAIARDRANRHPSIGALRRELERFATEHSLRRHPQVWSFLPAAGVARPLLPPPPEKLVRRPHPTLITPRIPIRAGIFGWAAAALAVLLGAGLSVAYYAYEPTSADAEESAMPGPAPPTAPAPSPAPNAEAGSVGDEEALPAPESEREAPHREDEGAAEKPAAEARPRARRTASRRPRARREAPTTTVVFAPSASPATTERPSSATIDLRPIELSPIEPPPSNVRAAELFEPISRTVPSADGGPARPLAHNVRSAIPPSPYEQDEAPPDNPF